MKNAGVTKIGLLTLLAGGAIWWSFTARNDELVTENARSDDAAIWENAVELPQSGNPIAPFGEEVDESEISALSDFLGNWSERYPEGKRVETRLKRLSENRFRLQSLIETGSERIPWVVWEEKLVREVDGTFSHFGSVAHMGNAFLTELRPGQVSDAGFAAFLDEHDLFVERRSRISDYVCLGFDAPKLGRLEFLIAAFQERFPGVLVEFDTLSYPGATPNDWDASRMWGLDTIRARDAWTIEKGDSNTDVVIAIIDTGTQTDHFDILDNLFINPSDDSVNGRDDDGNGLVDDVSGWDFVNDDSDPDDEDGHGTHVAGIAGAKGNNATGSVGVNWGVTLLPLKVGTEDGLRTSAINDALAYVRFLKVAGINIVATNNSYGSGGSNASTRNEISQHQNLDILFVAAAGNDGRNMDVSPDALEFPAGYTLDNIISVANSRQDDTLNDSSNYGTTSVDLSAPGSEIYAPYPNNSYAFLSGTSMASPMVAGAVGLLAQAEPDLTAAQLKARLIQGGDAISSQSGLTVSGRRLNLLAALKPELLGHNIGVKNVSDFIVLFEDQEGDVEFTIEAHPDASVSALVVFGAAVGRVESLGNRVYRFIPTGSGQAKVRFVSSLQGISKSVERTIIVGDMAPVQEGLIHHYSFEGTGGFAEDLAGSSDAAFVGANREGSEFGQSTRFDSATEKLQFNGRFSDAVTIAALVRSDDLRSSPHPRIVNMPFYYLYFSTGEGPGVPDGNRETLKFYSFFDLNPSDPDQTQPDIGVWNAPPRSIEQNQWYYVVATYNSTSITNTPKLYINAERQSVRVQNEPRGSIVSTEGTSYIGNNGSDSRAFDGLMADVRIYNRELNPLEVSDLGAALIQDKWDSVELTGPAFPAVGAVWEFAVSDSDNLGSTLSVDWRVEGGIDFEVVSEAGARRMFQFSETGVATIVAQVSDGVATRIFTKDIEVLGGSVTEGRYHGNTETGGIVWLEVDEGLQTGAVSIFDPDTGFYRIREAVTIEENGTFRSVENSVGSISGQALGDLTGSVPGYGVSFEGEYRASPSTGTEFEGNYLGGSLGIGGDGTQLEILSDGRAYLVRSGPRADLGLASVDIDRTLSFVSALGLEVTLQVSGEGGVVTGEWGEDQVFMKLNGEPSDAALQAGFVGGVPMGASGSGLYSEFVAEGEDPLGRISGGAFAKLEARSEASGSFILLDSSGKAHPVVPQEGQDLESAIAEAIDSLDSDSKRVERIRLQAPLSENGVSAVAFSVSGTEPLEILMRGLGPSFVTGGAENPGIRFYQRVGASLVALSPNDDWAEGMLFTGDDENVQGAFLGLESGFESLGLAPLERSSLDAAQRVWLEPGAYLLIVERVDGTAGAGLIEVFKL